MAWKYAKVKAWIHRVQKFKAEAISAEEIKAWQTVEDWMWTLIRNDRHLDKRGNITFTESEEGKQETRKILAGEFPRE